LKSKYLILYFALAYAISWSIGIPLALQHLGIIRPILPLWTHYFVAYGPLFAALIVTGLGEGKAGFWRLWRRIFHWRIGALWWGMSLSPLLLGLIVIGIVSLATGKPLEIASLGEVNFLPPLGVWALALWLLTFGLGEEIGWRGYALPRMQNGRSALAATLILAVLWALWHVPQFFYLFEPAIAVGWFIGLSAGAIVFTWLYNSTGGSVLAAAVWHGCFNFITASSAGGIVAAVVSVLVMIWAVIVVLVFKPLNLSARSKIVES